MRFGFAQDDWDRAKSQAMDALRERARLRGMMPYSELVGEIRAIRLQPESPALAALLGEISTEEDAAGRGMLSVIVVHKVGDMEPGLGFYKLATELGKPTRDRAAFWVSELHRVHSVWSAKGSLQPRPTAHKEDGSQP